MSDPKTSITAYAASGASFLLGWAGSNAASIGAMCAVITLVVNWYYKHRHFKLAEKRLSEIEE